MLQTPLYAEHAALGARLAPFAGWEMPIQYAGILAEHQATRNASGLFDTCHMGQVRVSGPRAAADLERLLTQRIGNLAVGQCRYGYLLADDGGVLDDLTCYRLADSEYLLVVNAGTRLDDVAWVQAHLSAGTRCVDESDATAKLDLQGPGSYDALAAALGRAPPALGYFRAVEMEWDGLPLLLSRTGYTGEWGYELYFPAEQAVAVWRRLLSQPGVQPCGLGARDTLRLEMGYPLYGHELSRARSPVPVGQGAYCDLDKDFIGLERVRQDLARADGERLVGLLLDGRRAARAGAEVLAGTEVVGQVTSGSFSPCLGQAIALAHVAGPRGGIGQRLEVVEAGRRLTAQVVFPPFYKQGPARRRPSASQ
ncbi:MAG: glycine cleavage system aminomethyltransferase GcvT [Candidatus Marinimicrobia bacterium]|nr:glycine cleavage system aminomethyltransferase GcvT [Candidatus Neomarinimicrobiota bacterium]